MAELIYHPADSDIADRIQADLAQQSPADHVTIMLLSPQAVTDESVQAALEQALDSNQRIVPVLLKATPLPVLIEHLESVDFTRNYDFDRLLARLGPVPGELHLKVRTPAVIAANRRTAIIVAVFAVIMFLAALYGVGVLGIQAPTEEYDAIETKVIETRNAIIDGVLPHSTDDALNFEATVDRAAPTLRPLLVATATAIAGG